MKNKFRPEPDLFILYCAHIRERFDAKGIIIYNGLSNRLQIIGSPYARIRADNDNEAAA